MGVELAEQFIPGVEIGGMGVLVLASGAGDTLEKELANIGESDGLAARDAAMGEEREDFAEDVVDVAGGLELAGEGGELGADAAGFETLKLLAGVDGTKRRVRLVAQHLALAAVRELELAEIEAIGFRALLGHGSLGKGSKRGAGGKEW